MNIVEESANGYTIECSCGAHIHALKSWGVVECASCGRQRDPRRLKHKWARANDPTTPNDCQAL